MFDKGSIALFVGRGDELNLVNCLDLEIGKADTKNLAVYSFQRLNFIFKNDGLRTNISYFSERTIVPTILKSSEIQLTCEFWDCCCQFSFIHPRGKKEAGYCNLCDCSELDAPDSRTNEVVEQYLFNFKRNLLHQVWFAGRFYFGGFNTELEANNAIISFNRQMAKLNNQIGDLEINYSNWEIKTNGQ